ncbi:Membrane protein OS=Streptomyces antimycoticus OX=68175 GN=SANT12839_045850 PE=4 SV=1 [Streptomyces antimycoticus]
MAVAFTAPTVTTVQRQGGADESKEDAAVDEALAARSEAEGPAPERKTA